MAMNEGFNFAELCRLCSLKSNHQLQIFDKEGEQRQLLFKIRSCIPAVITKEDALPKNICQKCVYKLDMFYEFRVSCMTTDTVLKNYADSVKHIAASVNNQLARFYLLITVGVPAWERSICKIYARKTYIREIFIVICLGYLFGLLNTLLNLNAASIRKPKNVIRNHIHAYPFFLMWV